MSRPPRAAAGVRPRRLVPRTLVEEQDVRRLVTAIVTRFPGVALMFDVIPRWLSGKTLRGFHKTKHYTAPPMPWGVYRRAS